MGPSLDYVDGKVAKELDSALMSSEYGYSLQQLMEVAGLSVADALLRSNLVSNRVLVICGPGNNGGDGLVAARYLQQMGGQYRKVAVLYPFLTRLNGEGEVLSQEQVFYKQLVKQAELEGVAVYATEAELVDACEEQACDKKNSSEKTQGYSTVESLTLTIQKSWDGIIDAIFGFGFNSKRRSLNGTIYGTIIQAINKSKVPVVSVDIPTGWDVETGPPENFDPFGEHVDNADALYIQKPCVLVSLMAPKKCVASAAQSGAYFFVDGSQAVKTLTADETSSSGWRVLHFLGRPAVPRALAETYGLRLPLNYMYS